MKLEAQAQTKLDQLIRNGALPATQCGRVFLRLLKPLIEGGVVRWQRSGAGKKLLVVEAGALEDFYRHRFPAVSLPPDVESRVVAVGLYRDSKALANTRSEIISIRVWQEHAVLKCGQPVGAAAASASHGVFSFLLSPGQNYRLNGRFMLVENPSLFGCAEQLMSGLDGVIYGHGRISRRVLDWLVACDSISRVLHLPDYDPVGLSEFERLHSLMGTRVELFSPDDLETRFERFSNRELLKRRNSQAMLRKLRHSSTAAVRKIVALIDRHNAGLEQEALLLPII